MRVVLKEFESLADAYQFSDFMTMKGCEILELSPTQTGCRVLLKLNSDNIVSDSMELSESTLRAYLGLNNGQTNYFISLIEFHNLKDAFQLATLAETLGCLVHEIRALRGVNKSHHLIISHDKKETLDKVLSTRRAHTFSKDNRAFCDFLGFSDITIK